jgi:two-component system sensor histidine kinase/response regulator
MRPVSGVTILVVDDNAANRALASATLEDEGYRVVLASGGEEGVARFAAERPDCVLLDVRMPGVDGPTACERIRALPEGGEVPIIFVTALRDVDTFDRTLSAGGDDYLTKPYRPKELVARVKAALTLRRLAAERGELAAQLKHQRDDLQRLQLQKEQLVAYVVHDLKNPVNSIGLQAEVLLRDREGSDRGRRAGERIRDETRNLLRMITTLLDVARADAGQLAPAPRRLDLSALIGQVAGELELRASSAGVRLELDVTALVVDADPDLLRRVVENLVDNAIRHAPEDSEVRIATRRADGGVELRVRDHGAGLPAGQREAVFERFVRGTGPSAAGNRGLGLAFCKLAVEVHGGRIWVEDAGPGAAFCAWMPHVE